MKDQAEKEAMNNINENRIKTENTNNQNMIRNKSQVNLKKIGNPRNTSKNVKNLKSVQDAHNFHLRFKNTQTQHYYMNQISQPSTAKINKIKPKIITRVKGNNVTEDNNNHNNGYNIAYCKNNISKSINLKQIKSDLKNKDNSINC